VTKGPDCSKSYLQKITNSEETLMDEETNTRNEIKEYLDTRYICLFDSCWRIFRFHIHRHFPLVERMPVHLPNENYVTYNAQADITHIASQEFLHRTMLTEWFSTNQRYEEARDLCYCDFPSKWRWNDSIRTWERRQRDDGKIGHVYFVHPSCGERYYLKMLLLVVKGAQSYECLRTHNDITHSTFKEACNERGLLTNNKEWYNAFDETGPLLQINLDTSSLQCFYSVVGDK
jgi:hypothetical protein